MVPIFKVLADNVDVSAAIQQRLISITTIDEAGFKTDTCTIDLDDRDGLIELPRHGAKLQVFLGYMHTGLAKIGVYTVDEVSLTGFPETISINAKAADMRGDLKSQKSRSFEGITFGDLVKTIAGDNGLTGKTAADLAAISLPHIDQTEESDLHLITRLAKQYNGVAKVTHDTLIVAKSGQSKSVSGADLEGIVITKSMVSDYHASLADRGKYASVTATWHNKANGQKVAVSTSTSKPTYTLRHTYDSEEKAIQAARAKLDDLTQGATTLQLSLAVGDGNLFAESPLLVSGFRPGIDGDEWTTTRVEHTFSGDGFTTNVEAKIKVR
ncbi:hypothetical protein JWZ98_10020 [Methylomonas sp. EFPC1]|uniref:contractile injection system protein, VgrG/Pvc8 family n=1 Tax=Methylomonas sp. EFPC1 TaxID=2812647 RepID=UPI001966F2B9|nr:contractile injection system protein, VgrG/Pvc8 family [Methylomonas sp. EFPC1]QSB03231.1 hypothetical protein JWZ98_10020 [Methylomonas sp. EFPC1]